MSLTDSTQHFVCLLHRGQLMDYNITFSFYACKLIATLFSYTFHYCPGIFPTTQPKVFVIKNMSLKIHGSAKHRYDT